MVETDRALVWGREGCWAGKASAARPFGDEKGLTPPLASVSCGRLADGKACLLKTDGSVKRRGKSSRGLDRKRNPSDGTKRYYGLCHCQLVMAGLGLLVRIARAWSFSSHSESLDLTMGGEKLAAPVVGWGPSSTPPRKKKKKSAGWRIPNGKATRTLLAATAKNTSRPTALGETIRARMRQVVACHMSPSRHS